MRDSIYDHFCGFSTLIGYFTFELSVVLSRSGLLIAQSSSTKHAVLNAVKTLFATSTGCTGVVRIAMLCDVLGWSR